MPYRRPMVRPTTTIIPLDWIVTSATPPLHFVGFVTTLPPSPNVRSRSPGAPYGGDAHSTDATSISVRVSRPLRVREVIAGAPWP